MTLHTLQTASPRPVPFLPGKARMMPPGLPQNTISDCPLARVERIHSLTRQHERLSFPIQSDRRASGRVWRLASKRRHIISRACLVRHFLAYTQTKDLSNQTFFELPTLHRQPAPVPPTHLHPSRSRPTLPFCADSTLLQRACDCSHPFLRAEKNTHSPSLAELNFKPLVRARRDG